MMHYHLKRNIENLIQTMHQNKEIYFFLIIGISTVFIDFLSYQFLINLVNLSFDISKGVSFSIGTIYAYFLNRKWTFRNKNSIPRSFSKFIILYTTTMFVNIKVNSSMLDIFSSLNLKIILSFLIATFVSATLNYLGMKFYVFR